MKKDALVAAVARNAEDIDRHLASLDELYDDRRQLLNRAARAGAKPGELAVAARRTVEAIGAIRRRAQAKSRG